MSRKDIASVTDLKGKTIAVSQIGDPPYNYTSALLAKFGLGPRDVQWIAAGADANGRAAALASGPRRRHAADAAGLLQARRSRLQESRQPRRPRRHLRGDDVPDEEEHGRREPQAARAADQGARRGDQALLRRQGVRGEGLSGVRQADNGRRRALLRRLREGQPPRARALRAHRRGQAGDRSAERPAAGRADEGRSTFGRVIDNSMVEPAGEGRLLPEAVRARRSRPKRSARRSWRSDRHAGHVPRRPRRQLSAAARDARRAQRSPHHARARSREIEDTGTFCASSSGRRSSASASSPTASCAAAAS